MNAIPAPKLDPREQHFRIPGPRLGLQLFLRRLEPVRCRAHPVLYVHGGTFPSALSIAHRFDGYSWREPCARPSSTSGAWISTASDRPTATRRWTSPPRRTRPFAAPPTPSPSSRPPRPSSSRSQAGPRLSLIAHSWGTLPTGRFAGAYPDLVDRLVLFGPIARRTPPGREPDAGRTGLAGRDPRRPVVALRRGRARRRAGSTRARPLRGVGRTLSRQRSWQPVARPT